MKRYVDVEEIEKTISKLMPSLSTPDGTGQYDREIYAAQEMCVDIMYAIHALPTVDVNPVIHAHWEPWLPMDVSEENDYWCCSVCGRRAKGKIEDLPYCHCGAKMDKEIKNGT